MYEDVYGALEQSLATNGPLRGALFWRWSLDGGDDTSVNAGDSVWGCVPYYWGNLDLDINLSMWSMWRRRHVH